MTFTTANWDTVQTVTVSAGHDADATNDTVTLLHRASGGGYSSLSAVTVAVTVVDDDTAEPDGPVTVKLVQVPDGTFIPDDPFSVGSQGVTVLDGLRFDEGELVYYRLLFEAVGGGLPPATALTWRYRSPGTSLRLSLRTAMPVERVA